LETNKSEKHNIQMALFSTPLKSAHIVIHGFALAHALTAALFILIRHSDPGILLSILTIAMILIITHLNEYPLDVTMALALICCLAGFFLGTTGADFFTDILSVSAVMAQIITTVLVTEMLGWITYLIVRRAHQKE
jgi:hypothetical protein